jgi:hypothetical protein
MTDATTNTGAPKRPTFLTVLCILSFIGCAWGAYSGITGYFEMKAMATSGAAGMQEIMDQAMDESMASGEVDAQSAEMAKDLANSLVGSIDYASMANASLIQGILCLIIGIGVFMMWNLKKTGFYVYTVCQIAYVLVPFIMVGGLAGGLMGVLGAIFPIVFIILYGLNLKHMR